MTVEARFIAAHDVITDDYLARLDLFVGGSLVGVVATLDRKTVRDSPQKTADDTIRKLAVDLESEVNKLPLLPFRTPDPQLVPPFSRVVRIRIRRWNRG